MVVDQESMKNVGYRISRIEFSGDAEMESLYVEENYRGLGIVLYASNMRMKVTKQLYEVLIKMIFETERLRLRPWTTDDADSLYKYAKDPLVGPIAGWPVHTSVENSCEIIKVVLSASETYAVCLKENNEAIGSIGLLIGEKSNIDIAEDEAEIGYWIGVPFWGQGLIPEATKEIMRYAFDDLGMKQLWCGYFDGNEKSKRVQEKCGFQYLFTDKDKKWELMNDIRTEHITCITRMQWSKRRVFPK